MSRFTYNENWIGLNNRNPGDVYAWIDGQAITTWDQWSAVAPTGAGCGFMYEYDFTGGQWGDTACSTAYGYYCQSNGPGKLKGHF